MLRNMVRKSVSFLLIMVMMAGLCCAAETQETQDTQDSRSVEEHLAEKAAKLGEKYGYMSVGTARVVADNDMTEMLFPEEAAEHDEGILFTDIHDYDGDGTPELLLFRRQEGYTNFEHAGGVLSGIERSEYLIELYKYYDSGYCGLYGRFVAGVADQCTIFTSHMTMTVFRRDYDGKSDLYLETFMSGQDHPEDIGLLRLRFENGTIRAYDGLRYGALFFGEKNVQYMEPKSIEAFGSLSYSGSAEESLWDKKAAENEYDESFMSTLEAGLSNLGLTLLKTRRDAIVEHNAVHDANEDPDIEEALMEISALDCYGAGSGELTPLAVTYLHRGLKKVEKQGYSYKLNRTIYTDDPAGTERPVLGPETESGAAE